jgi:hypothetical protein
MRSNRTLHSWHARRVHPASSFLDRLLLTSREHNSQISHAPCDNLQLWRPWKRGVPIPVRPLERPFTKTLDTVSTVDFNHGKWKGLAISFNHQSTEPEQTSFKTTTLTLPLWKPNVIGRAASPSTHFAAGGSLHAARLYEQRSKLHMFSGKQKKW